MSSLPQNIFLIGFMGAGKTTIGKKLASKLQYKFIDLDAYIESQSNMTIAEMFVKYGEKEFRIIERDSLRKLMQEPCQIISCGGGTPIFHNNMDSMKAYGVVVYLESNVGKLFHRLKKNRFKRPLIKNLNDLELREFIIKKLEERNPIYREADIVFNTDLGMLDLIELVMAHDS